MLYLLRWRVEEPTGEGAHGPEQDGDEESWEEAVDGHAFDERAHEPDEKRVDDEGEETEGYNVYGKREKDEDRSEDGVE